MNKVEIHRIKKGKLVRNNEEITLRFGLIYENDGFISAEFYVEETFDLEQYYEISYDEDTSYFKAFCTTDKGEYLELRKLDFRRISPHRGLIEMVCYDCLLLTKDQSYLPSNEENSDSELHYLELEGLEMEYCTATKHERTSNGKNIGPYDVKWDHTTTALSCNFSLYNMSYYKDYESGNVVVNFDSSTNSLLTYKNFIEFKKNYLSMLSFINGAEVRVRKECFGNYRTVGKIEAEKIITYSYRKIINLRSNQYIPINHILNRPINILEKFMLQNFESFIHWNKMIDLSSIIQYLNGAAQTKSLEEQFFILIIAFERLTDLYANQTGAKDLFHPLKYDYAPIKNELFEILNKHKSSFGEYFVRAKSVIGGLNHIQRLSTKDKMYGIINDMKIELTDDLVTLIDVVRNEAVHRGFIGEGEEGYKNVLLLNELIHEIILNLIKYLGPRKSTVLFGRTIMTIDTPINSPLVFNKEEPR
ncbi:MAG TPA: hypothetical protein VK766_03415 [Cytophagaceae bacterium]|jgi:hypothetical protein|nr:hypothetical protein [Cytophagaceae bacterium]